MHTSLLYCRCRSDLKALAARGEGVGHVQQRDDAHVLETVADALAEVGDEQVERPFVHNRPRDAGGQRRLGLVEHAPAQDGRHRGLGLVVLEALPVREEVVPGALLHAGQQAAHHHRRRAHRQGLGGAARVGDAPVGHDGHAVLAPQLGAVVDGRDLGTAHRLHHLGGGDAAHAHPDAHAVGARLDHPLALPPRGHVAAHHVHAGEGGLQPPDPLQGLGGVPLAHVQREQVDAGGRQRRRPLLQLRQPAVHRHRRAHLQALGGSVLGGQGELVVLDQVHPCGQRPEAPVLVDDRQMALLALLQDPISRLEVAGVLGAGEFGHGGHHRSQGLGPVRQEVGVALGDHAQQPGAHAAVRGHGHPRDALRVPERVQVLDCGVRGKAVGLQDEPVLIALHIPHHLHLLLEGARVVYDAEAPVQGHPDGHFGTGNRVHGRADEW
mmetsp:Transcript_50134/g.86238  ORF Transcript_50134/g.86238 Transcript_50134/m.86238 type:complete len:438 (+) Transcript_50134:93-1406(+)